VKDNAVRVTATSEDLQYIGFLLYVNDQGTVGVAGDDRVRHNLESTSERLVCKRRKKFPGSRPDSCDNMHLLCRNGGLEGYTNEEIATHLGCELRTAANKLRLIRLKWEQK
jgi:hypothetical protein